MGVHHVEASPHKNVCANNETSCGEVAIFNNVAEKGFQLNEEQIDLINICRRSFFKQLQCRQTVNFNTVQGLALCLALLPKRDHCNLVTRVSE